MKEYLSEGAMRMINTCRPAESCKYKPHQASSLNASSIRKATMKDSAATNCWQGERPSHTCWWKRGMHSHSRKAKQSLTKLHSATIQSSSHMPEHSPSINMHLCSCKNLDSVPSCSVPSNQRIQTQMSFNSEVNYLWYIHSPKA